MITIDGPIRTASIRGLFSGSFGGKLGTYAFLGSSVSDLSRLEVDGTIMFEGNWAIVAGSGTGSFEGVCGFATFSLNDVITVEDPHHLTSPMSSCSAMIVKTSMLVTFWIS